MNAYSKRILVFLLICLLPLYTYAVVKDEHLGTRVTLISVCEFILFITSLISIKQFIWKDEYNRTGFQIFNALFVIVFYSISFTFLVRHKDFWDGYEHLSDSQAIEKFFLSKEPFAIIKKLIFVAFILNIIYIIRYSKDYFTDG